MQSGLWRKLVAGGLVILSGAAYAQEQDKDPWDTFSFSLGGFLTQSDTSIRVDSQTLGVGVVVDLENALGVESDFDTFRIDTRYRFGQSRRHDIELHYFDSKRSGDKTLDQDIQIGDNFFPAGTGVTTEFELEFINVDYVYNFLMDDRVRLGVSAGLHTTGISLRVAESGGTKVEDENFTAPLPMVGLRAEVILADHWRLKTDFNFFYIEYEQYTGRLGDAFIGVEYMPWKHFGIGVGANSISYEIEGDGDGDFSDFNGELEFQLTGFTLYGRYFF